MSLVFAVSAAGGESVQAFNASSDHQQPQIKLPMGWSLLVPPRKLDLTRHTEQNLSMAVAVPPNARAGAHLISLTMGTQSVDAKIIVEAHHTIEWIGNHQSDQPIQRWWSDRPLSINAAVVLTGNQSLQVELVSRAPRGVKIDLSEADHRLVPSVVENISINVSRDPMNRRLLPRRLAIAIDIIDASTDEVLATRRWLLAPFDDRSSQSLKPLWDMRGFIDWRSTMQHGPSPFIQPDDWGIRGFGYLDKASTAHMAFAWHQDARWGRYIGFEGTQFRWQFGRQVFLGQRLDGLSRLGQGISASWQSEKAVGAWRMGWIDFQADGNRYRSPWLSQGRWRVAYIDTSSSRSDAADLGDWWSLGYRSPTDSEAPMRRGIHRWVTQFTGNHDRLAAHIQYRYQPDSETWLGVWAESIPTNHISRLPAGKRFRVQSRQALNPDAYVTASLAIGRRPNMNHSKHYHQVFEINHWQYISSDRRVRLGLNGIHQRNWIASANPLERGWRTNSTGHKTAFAIRLIGELGDWYWAGRLDTRGRFGLMTRWKQPNIGMWRLSLQNTNAQLSIEGSKSGQWQWSAALDRRRSRALPNSGDGAIFGLDNNVENTLLIGASRVRIHLNVSRRVSRLQEWSLTLSPSTTDISDTTLWLRYRWRWRGSSPLPAISDWRGREQAHTVSGKVQRLTPDGLKPVPGIIVSLNDRSTQTDLRGRYRFSRVRQGSHRLAIENWFDGESSNETMAVEREVSRDDWLLTTNDKEDIWVGSVQTSSDQPKGSKQPLTHDWLWVIPSRVVVDLAWPEDSPIDSATKSSVMDEMRLVGRCDACPSRHQRRTAKRNAQGQWVVDGLMPGRWHWRWVGALLPTEHEFKEVTQWHDATPSRAKKITWQVLYRPHPIEWQGTQSVELQD